VKLTTHLHLVPRSRNAWSYTSIPPIRLHGVVLSLKYRDNFTFYLYTNYFLGGPVSEKIGEFGWSFM
jgi:hypothetical protein